MERIIWSNENLDYDDWKADLEEEYPDMSEDDRIQVMYETNDIYLEDEVANLNIQTNGRILAIADLGLWYGRRKGYRILTKNVNSVFNVGEDYNTYYFDGNNVKAKCIHHDGTNYILYREIREDRNIDNLLNAIYRGEEISNRKLNYYTKSIRHYVKEVYGW